MKTQLKKNEHLVSPVAEPVSIRAPARDCAAATGGRSRERGFEARRCGALPAAEILARCSRRRSKSSQGGSSSKGLRSAALQQLAELLQPASPRHRASPPSPRRNWPGGSFSARLQGAPVRKGVSTGHQSVCTADSQP